MRMRTLALLALVLVCVGCDQATKLVAIEHLKGEPMQSFFGDVFRLVYAENTGAFLGLGADWPDWLRIGLLSAFVPVLLVVLGWGALSKEATNRTAFALALLVGGGLGNLVDRIWRDGRVVDFMNMGIGPVRTGIFNVADVQLMVGVGLLLVWGMKKAPPPEPALLPKDA